MTASAGAGRGCRTTPVMHRCRTALTRRPRLPLAARPRQAARRGQGAQSASFATKINRWVNAFSCRVSDCQSRTPWDRAASHRLVGGMPRFPVVLPTLGPIRAVHTRALHQELALQGSASNPSAEVPTPFRSTLHSASVAFEECDTRNGRIFFSGTRKRDFVLP